MSGVPVAPVVSAAVSAVGSINPLDTLIIYLNSNPYFIGIMMLLLNLGGRFLALEVTKEQEKFFQHPWVRRFLIFVVFFMGTRNVFVAFVMWVIAILLMGYLFNENSSLCLFKAGTSSSTCASDGSKSVEGMTNTGLTLEEQEIYRRLHEKQMKITNQNAATVNQDEKKKPVVENLTNVYWQNMLTLGANPRF